MYRSFRTELPFSASIFVVFTIIAGFILPALLIPIAKFTGCSEVCEEAAKTIVILFLILKLPNYKLKVVATLVFGLLFGLSEDVFYLNNLFLLGNLDIFWLRLTYTLPMHIVTSLFILFSGMASKKLLLLGFLGAVFLHALFNYVIVDLLV